MEVIHLKAGENVAKRKDKVSAWYIVQEGNVTLRHEFEETTLGPNAIIGILEQDWFICDYYASTDVTLYVFPCEGVNDLKQFLAAEPKMRRIFLRSALLQRHQLFCASVKCGAGWVKCCFSSKDENPNFVSSCNPCALSFLSSFSSSEAVYTNIKPSKTRLESATVKR